MSKNNTKKIRSDFCFFILTHNRPEKLYTLKTIEKAGYTGKYYLVVDDEDPALEKYKEIYGDKVLVFNKDEIAKKFDRADNFNKKGVIIYARNVCFDLAEQVGCKYFMELDDDYTEISVRFNEKGIFQGHRKIKNFDEMLNKFVDFYIQTPAKAIAFAQGGDFIGGVNGTMGSKLFLKRKIMNTILCSTERPFKFHGTINEDVNTYVGLGGKGDLFFTVNLISINQVQTQANSGGMTETYLESGTYLKSFYSVIFNPSCVKITRIGNLGSRRIHHKINWKYAVPKIISEDLKKK